MSGQVEEIVNRKWLLLELYQNALLNANLLAVENINPYHLQPELWKCVLDHLKDWRDLYSCFETCQLFRDLVTDTNKNKNNWLFSGVLPLIEKYLPEDALLKCRRMCKTWKEEVDKDNSSSLRHRICFKMSPNGRASTEQKVETMVLHGKTPFVGQIVVIESDLELVLQAHWRELQAQLAVGIWQDVENVENHWRDHHERVLSFLVQDITNFLNGLGRYISSLIFNVTPGMSNATVLFKLILCMLWKCQSLKTLRIMGLPNNRMVLESLRDLQMDDLTPEDFNLAPTFQALFVTHLYGFVPIQNRILRLSARQLKKLQSPWTPNFRMSALEELDIYYGAMQLNHLNPHEDLMQLRAPRLKKLAVHVNTNCTLHNLLTLTSRYHNLQHLTLHWNDNFQGFPMEQLLGIPEEIQPPQGLKTLQFLLKDGMNFDFLIYFPRVETLRLSSGYSLDVTEKLEQDAILQVSKHWMQESAIYVSNVWEVLPFLKAVRVTEHFFDFEDDTIAHVSMFTRKEYNDYN